MTGRNFAHAQDYLNLPILLMFQGTFTLDMEHMVIANAQTCSQYLIRFFSVHQVYSTFFNNSISGHEGLDQTAHPRSLIWPSLSAYAIKSFFT